MRRLLSVFVALCGCSADPGYEPRYEPHESHSSPEAAQPPTTTKSIEAPRKTIVALQACADKFALKLSGKADSYAVLYNLEATNDGITAKVKDSMISGSELETCLTQALERMEVPDEVVSASQVSPATSQVSPQSRSMVGVVQVAAVVIALGPIVLVAGGVTILVGVSIVVAEEVAQALRRRKKWENDCQEELNKCLLTDLADEDGSVEGSRRCAMCWDECRKTKGTWPWKFEISSGKFVSCAYWVPKWKR